MSEIELNITSSDLSPIHSVDGTGEESVTVIEVSPAAEVDRDILNPAINWKEDLVSSKIDVPVTTDKNNQHDNGEANLETTGGKSDETLDASIKPGAEQHQESLPEEQQFLPEEPDVDWELFPYGPSYEEITHKHLKDIDYELGLIKLCWPEISSTDIQHISHCPSSYIENSKKEKLLLLYSENFRRQFHNLYTDRKPLLLAVENECGIQKMVCTTIRPTSLPYSDLYTWQGCAQFVADHISYQPLQKVTLLPEQLFSPSYVLSSRLGHCFEMSILLVSYLIAAGYKAYVVSGYATREICTNDRSRLGCPYLETLGQEEAKTDTQVDPKYSIKPPRDLTSKFLLEMEMRVVRKQEEKERLEREQARLDKEAYEQPQPDDFAGVRVHSWVVLLPGGKDVEQALFIEPASGCRYALDYDHYFGIESIWDNTNYWVNMQKTTTGCKDLKFDLMDVNCWEHLLAGEPWQQRRVVEPTEEESEIILQEKHLDIPVSWVKRLDIANTTFQDRYPQGMKVTYYKCATVEEFAPFIQSDGLVRRISTYQDLDCELPEMCYEYYENRADLMVKVTKNLVTDVYVEEFIRGREDALKDHTYKMRDNTAESQRTLTFYHEARLDGLAELEMNPEFVTQNFTKREDLQYYRHAVFEQRSMRGNMGMRRAVLKLTERFHRNKTLKADEDIAQRVFALSENQIQLKFHYEDGKVTASTRVFIKPPPTEQGDRLTFNPELSFGYQSDPAAPQPKNLDMFLLLQLMLATEEKSLAAVRTAEEELGVILLKRSIELGMDKLTVSIFDKERNMEAKLGMREREELANAKKLRETHSQVDYLAPYFARLGNPTFLTDSEALKMKGDCLTDYKQLLVDRANRIQLRFEAESTQLEEKRIWFEEAQESLSLEEEEAYFEFASRTTFYMHTLEIRLNRHRDLAPQRYLAVEGCLRTDPRLNFY